MRFLFQKRFGAAGISVLERRYDVTGSMMRRDLKGFLNISLWMTTLSKAAEVCGVKGFKVVRDSCHFQPSLHYLGFARIVGLSKACATLRLSAL